MILVLDTNIWLQPQANLWEFVSYFPMNQEPPVFFIGVDRGGLIVQEYLKHITELRDEVKTAVQRLLDGAALFVVRPQVFLPNTLKYRLMQNSCMTPIEPQLFCVAAGTQGIIVCPNSNSSLPIPRMYTTPSVLERIQENGVGPCVLSLAETLKLLRKPREYSPEDLSDLQALIGQYREEREFLEFKNPVNDFLTPELLRTTVQAVCGMLNTRNGYVIIGVDDQTGDIHPFTPRYKGTSDQIGVDHVERCILQEIDRISPKPGNLVHVWPLLDDANKKCVFVIYVEKGNRDYIYRDTEERRWKLNRVKWIRSGNRTIPDPNWQVPTFGKGCV
jgi:hypothetical protein